MPWSHCENGFLLDDEDCPTCGFTKAEWTVEVEHTRTFTVKRTQRVVKSWLEFDVQGPSGRPLAAHAYELTLPDGRMLEGVLDAQGHARHEGVPAGECQVVVRGSTLVDLEAVDAAGRPLAGGSYRLTLPNGSVREGCFDERGRASEEGVPPGPCELVVSRD